MMFRGGVTGEQTGGGYRELENNEVIKAFGQLPYELIAQFPNVQVFGAVGDKTLPAWAT